MISSLFPGVLNMQQDANQTIAQLIDELRKLRQLNLELETSLTKSKEEEARFRAVSEESLDGIIITDQDGNIIFWNKTAAEIFGYEKEEIIGSPVTMVISDEAMGDYNAGNEHVVKTGFSLFGRSPKDKLAKRKDGTIFLVDLTVTHWKVGEKYYFGGSIRDITERKRQEEVLRESEERFRAVAESSVDAIWITDRQGNIVFWNKAAEAIFGYKENEIVGKSAELLMPRLLINRHREAMDKLIQEGVASLMNNPIETVATKKGGVEFPVEITVSKWKTERGYCFGTIIRDITERKRAETALLQEKYFADTVINSLPGVFYLLNQKGQFIRWNSNLEKTTGFSANEMQKINAISLIHKADRAQIEDKIEKVFNSGYADVEGRLLDKNGRAHHYFFTGKKFDIDGQSYLTGLGIDIAQRKRMESELKKSHTELEKKVNQRTAELMRANKKLQMSEEHLKRFAGRLLSVREEERKNISTTLHDELGTMALSVTSKLSITEEEIKDSNNKAALRALKESQAAVRKAVEDLRRLAVDLRPPNLEIMGLTAALTDLLDKVREQAKFKILFRNELVNKKIPEDTAIVIYRVIQEAITNVTKYAKAKNARIKLYADKKNLYVEITDDGIGCDLNKVLYRKGKPKIGIAGMIERVEILGGKITIASVPKQGTQLKVTLPVKE
jgi:PAS domain S-box-containing protein